MQALVTLTSAEIRAACLEAIRRAGYAVAAGDDGAFRIVPGSDPQGLDVTFSVPATLRRPEADDWHPSGR